MRIPRRSRPSDRPETRTGKSTPASPRHLRQSASTAWCTGTAPSVRPLRFAQGRQSDGPTLLHLSPPGEMLSAMLRRSAFSCYIVLTVATLGACERRGGCTTAFFFQAEDGIRDLIVTGVQTCALPI